ncbi:ABC transporter permease [Halorussus halophilus]|uniref:ABC transporter permease n=1 Tax=Halorussus halophilus TaxID=2650975 RepID=UPI0013013223|nr:ABC transporter permease subunit [Halorussus halophilus]
MNAVRAATSRFVPPFVVGILAVVGWATVIRLADVPEVVFPGPTAVATTLVRTWPELARAAGVTVATAGAGLLVGATLGLTIALAMTVSETTAAVARPYVVALRIVPLVAIAPILFRWFGDGFAARAILAATLAVFPVTVSAREGLRATPRELLDLARSVDASTTARLLRIRLPAAAPETLAGTKIAAAASVVGAVVAEFLTLDAGLGYRIFRASTRLQSARMVAALVVLALVGVAFYLLPVAVESGIRNQ